MKRYLMMAMALMVLAACDKDNGGGGGNSDTWQPSKAGSTWTYRVQDNTAGSSFNFTLAATSRDSVASGKSWRIFSNGGGNEYYRQEGSIYYQFGRFEGLGSPLELPYLNADAAQGQTWVETRPVQISGITLNVTFTFTMVAKGVSRTIGTVTFPNVNQVGVTLSAPGLTIASQRINYWYALNVGRIESEAVLNIPLAAINFNNRTTLASYTIVP